MAKRVILVSLTLLGILLCLLIYQQLSRDFAPPAAPYQTDIGEESPTSPAQDMEMIEVDVGQMTVSVGKIEGFHYAARDDHNRIIREFGFKERLSREGDIFTISLPWIRFHSADGRLIEVLAPTGQMPLEIVEGQIKEPPRGSLFGGVKIALREQDPNQPAELLVELDRLEFEREFSRLSSRGTVRISGDQVQLAGTDLNLQYDQVTEQLQELELHRLEYLRLNTASLQKSSTPIQTDTSEQLEKPTPKTQPPDKKADIYQLTLHRHVQICQGPGRITAEKVEILSRLNASKDRSSRKLLKSQQATSSEKHSKDQPSRQSPDEPNQMVELTCSGPLRIEVLKDKTLPEPGARLLINALGSPAHIWREQKIIGRADNIQYINYDSHREIVKLVTDDPCGIWLSPSRQQFLTGREVTFDPCESLARLLGPGDIHYILDDPCSPALIHYQDMVKLKFSDPRATSGTSDFFENQPVAWLDFSGPLSLVHPDGALRAGRGHLEFYTPVKPALDHKQKRPVQQTTAASQLKSIELGGQVFISDPCSFFTTEHLLARFELDPNNVSRLTSIRAQGDVKAKNRDYILQAKDELLARFNLKTQSPDNKDTNKKSQPTRPQKPVSAPSQLLALQQPNYILAQGPSGTVRFVDRTDPNEILEVSGNRIEGHSEKGEITKDGLLQIRGRPAQVRLADRAQLTGSLLSLDLAKRVCSIPEKGNLQALSSNDFAGKKLGEPVPVEIAWQQGAQYSMDSNEVVLNDVTAHLEKATPEMIIHDQVNADRMTMILEKTKQKDQSRRELSRLSAQGPNVQLIRRQTAPETGELLVKMEMLCQDIRFDKYPNLLTAAGEGLIEISDYRTPQEPSASPESEALENILSASLGGSGPSFTLIHFLKRMDFAIDQGKIHFHEGVALHRIPTNEIKPSQLDTLNIPGSFRLHSEEVIVIRASESANEKDKKKKTKQQDNPDQLGIGKLGFLQALGNVWFEVISSKGKRHIGYGQILTFDGPTNTVTLKGSETLPVRFDQTQFLWFKYNLKTGDFSGKPLGSSIINDVF